MALDLTNQNKLWLYTANELNNRAKGTAQISRYNAMTGEKSWTLELNVAKNKKKNSWTVGVKASPVIGQEKLGDLVYFTAAGITAAGAGELGLGSKAVDAALLAIHKDTGKLAWAYALPSYTESSPVAVYSEAGRGWILQCCADGTILLLDGLTGKLVNSLKVTGSISASPAVFGSTMVIATTGTKANSFIYGITL